MLSLSPKLQSIIQQCNVFNNYYSIINLTQNQQYDGYFNNLSQMHGLGIISQNDQQFICVHIINKMIYKQNISQFKFKLLRTSNDVRAIGTCDILTNTINGVVFLSTEDRKSVRMYKNNIELQKLVDYFPKTNHFVVYYAHDMKSYQYDATQISLIKINIIYPNNTYYMGYGTQEGIQYGQGFLTNSDGSWIIGVFTNGKLQQKLRSKDQFGNICVYEKQIQEFYQGEIYFYNGNKWKGLITNQGKMHGEGVFTLYSRSVDEVRFYDNGQMKAAPFYDELIRRTNRIKQVGLFPKQLKVYLSDIDFQMTFQCQLSYYLSNLRFIHQYDTLYQNIETESFSFVYYRLFCKHRVINSNQSQINQSKKLFKCYDVDF